MAVDNSESVLVESNSRFLNKAFVKGFLAGLTIGVGFFISSTIGIFLELSDRLESIESVVSFQILPTFIINCVMPLLIIYLVGLVVKFALGRYGFEGWTKGRMNFVHLFGALLGLFVGTMTYLIVALILSVV